MVAANIQWPAPPLQGTSALPERITASSHGGFITDMDAFPPGIDNLNFPASNYRNLAKNGDTLITGETE